MEDEGEKKIKQEKICDFCKKPIVKKVFWRSYDKIFCSRDCRDKYLL